MTLADPFDLVGRTVDEMYRVDALVGEGLHAGDRGTHAVGLVTGDDEYRKG